MKSSQTQQVPRIAEAIPRNNRGEFEQQRLRANVSAIREPLCESGPKRAYQSS